MRQGLPFHTPQAYHNGIHSVRDHAAYQDEALFPVRALPVERQYSESDSKIAAAEYHNGSYERRWRELATIYPSRPKRRMEGKDVD